MHFSFKIAVCALVLLAACAVKTVQVQQEKLVQENKSVFSQAISPAQNETNEQKSEQALPEQSAQEIKPLHVWRPQKNATLQVQFTDLPIDQTVDADVFDLDLFDTNESVIADLHSKGKKVICYFSAGTYEDWRPDAESFHAAINTLGSELKDWPGEQWLDIRRIDLLAPIMTSRMDLCKQKGFDGVDPDNLDAFQQDTGFRVRDEDQRKYNIFIATQAHNRGLAVGLKNDFDHVRDLEQYFDFAITEECFQNDECDVLVQFLEHNKPVFDVEYTLELVRFCDKARILGIDAMKKRKELDGWKSDCRKL